MEQIKPERAKPSRIARAALSLGLLSVFGACLSVSLFIYVLANELHTGEVLENLSVILFFVFFLFSLAGVIVSLVSIFRDKVNRTQSIIGGILSLVSSLALGVPVALWLSEIF